MKKNAMLKIAAILMVAVLLTTCAISSTFAKYTTTNSDSTQARVAKWGVTVDSNIFTTAPLFASTYADGEGAVFTTNKLLMAPGTAGSIEIDNVIEGMPEVSGTVTIAVTFTLSGDWTIDGTTFYCPVQVKAGDDTAYKSFTGKGADNKLTSSYTINFDPNESLDTEVNCPLEWKWDFVNAGDDAAKALQDANDTKLADRAAAEGAEGSWLTVDIAITITQTTDAVEAA